MKIIAKIAQRLRKSGFMYAFWRQTDRQTDGRTDRQTDGQNQSVKRNKKDCAQGIVLLKLQRDTKQRAACLR